MKNLKDALGFVTSLLTDFAVMVWIITIGIAILGIVVQLLET